METADLVPLFGVMLAGLIINMFTRENTLIIAMLGAAALMAYLNRLEVDPELIIERITQGAGVVLVLYVITRLPRALFRVFGLSNFSE
jgi:hypothetical protein